jgi:hypothetical protein
MKREASWRLVVVIKYDSMSGSWYSKEVVGSVEIYKEGVEGFFEIC